MSRSTDNTVSHKVSSLASDTESAVLQVAVLLPELGMTVVQLTANLRVWYEQHTAELAASEKTAAEKEVEAVIFIKSNLYAGKSNCHFSTWLCLFCLDLKLTGTERNTAVF